MICRHAFNLLSKHDAPITIACTGASGRLAQSLKEDYLSKNVRLIPVPREIFHGSPDEIKQFYQKNGISSVLNCAVLSSGNRKEMQKVNVERPYELASVAEQMGIDFFQLSTTGALVPGISCEKTGYVKDKADIEQKLSSRLKNSSILRCDALIGDDSSKIDITMLAYPFRCQVKGNVAAQFASYSQAAQVIGNLLTQAEVPKEVNIAGDPVGINEFVKMINPDAKIEFEIDPKDPKVLGLMKVIDNGCATEEFMELFRLSEENPVVVDNSYYKKSLSDLGSTMKTPEELAELVRSTTTLDRVGRVAQDVLKKRDVKELITSGISVLSSRSALGVRLANLD